MYIEEFLDLINELDLRKLSLRKKQAQQLKKIVIEAGHEYNVRKFHKTLTKDIQFDIEDEYIEDSELLSKLGISVFPQEYTEVYSVSVDDNPFGPSNCDAHRYTAHKTSVIFPTKLFKSAKKADVLQLVKTKNNN